MDLPDNLKPLAQQETGAAWLADLPRLLSELSEDWNLQIGAPCPGGNVSYVTQATRDGEPVVLKIQWPHRESLTEADALQLWDGKGTVRLLAHDRERHALLLERCAPGTALSACHDDVDPLAVLTGLLPRLWKPAAAPFTSLKEEALGWASTLLADWDTVGQPCERRLVEAALHYISELSESQEESVLLHQDLHGDNVLAAEREAWLVIDPKPLVGERAFALAPIVRSFEFGHSRDQVLNRLNRLSADLNLDRERARGWTVAQTMAWSFDSGYEEQHYETLRWLLPKAYQV